MPPPLTSPLQMPLANLPGVGPERTAQLARLELVTVGDLLLHRPRRYEDRRHLLTIAELEPNRSGTTRGRIVAQGLKTYQRGARSVFEFVLDDSTARLHCRWWNLPFMERYFSIGDEVMVFGKIKGLKPRIMDHPETEVIESGEELSIHIDRIAPIYSLTEGLPQRWIRGLVWRTLQRFEAEISEPFPSILLPDLPGTATAVHQIHFPREMQDPEIARERLALNEFIGLQAAIQRRRRNLEANATALPCGGDSNRLIRPFLRQLGFELTAAQTRVLREIRADMSGRHPMRRLIQGDVGSGKTAVAACSALMSLESGFNVALMAPTEILAAQHYQTFTRWLRPLGIPVELQTGSRKTLATASKLRPGLDEAEVSPHGRPDQTPALFIGTHALIDSAFSMPRLGLVIIDEQHKFGVAQREKLVRKGNYPHLLVMTATPIPRTLGLTIYGDLDVSTIDELPPGRGVVRTYVRSEAQLPKVHQFIQKKLKEGRQVYVVFPRVDEGDAGIGIKAVTQECQRLQKIFAPARTGMLHGRLSSEEKDRVMTEFRSNRLQVLLATSVIEVGVDVPNATVMLVENASLFGLAQLHQLRGRIGRGAHESFCILISHRDNAEGHERLKVLASTTDGFEIAEADLRIRGPGELLGNQQSGVPALKFGDLRSDRALIERARELARQMLDREREGSAKS